MKRFLFIFIAFFMAVAMVEAVNCPRCNYYNVEGASFCSQCGDPLPQVPAYVQCPRCGFQNNYDAVFCSRCGMAFRQAPPPPQAEPESGFFGIMGGNVHEEHEHHRDRDEEHERDRDRHEGAQPRSGWQFIGTISNGGATTLPYNGPVHKIHLKCTSGDLIMSTLTILEGGKKNTMPLLARLKAGQEMDKDLPKTYQATGVWFSHRQTGTVEVSVQ